MTKRKAIEMTIVENRNDCSTPICYISGISKNVISGKIQNSENSIRSAQNVGRVLFSMGVQALIQKWSILTTISKGHVSWEFWGPGLIWA